jgi:hypothetical protein
MAEVTEVTEVFSRHGAWSSGLSTNDFAACVTSGLQPLGFVQGCCVVSWNFYGSNFSVLGGGFAGNRRPTGYFEQYNCPHGIVSAEHRMYGINYEKTWIEETWSAALQLATDRLLAEARQLGAHGVIGVLERAEHHGDTSSFEFSLSGTAVGIEGVPVPEHPFTTFLAGQKLNKLVESGFAPVAIALTIAEVGVYASCVTEYQLRGGNQWGWGGLNSEVDQVARAHAAARSLARERIRAQLDGDVLHAAALVVRSNESQEGPQIEVVVRGNRVRRFKAPEEIEPPRPVVNLVDR